MTILDHCACIENVCTCSNGVGAVAVNDVGANCTTHGDFACASCDPGLSVDESNPGICV